MMRIQHDRSMYVPKGARKFKDRQSSAVVYAYTATNGKPALMGFHGRAQKPDFRFWYQTEEARQRKAREHFEQWRRWEGARTKPRGLEVGDILRASWGYEQTNIDYYQVTALIGKSMVKIREIAQDAHEREAAAMQGWCVPVPDKFIGEPVRKRASEGGVRIASYCWASKVEPTVENGAKVYPPDHWTSYH